MLLRGKEVQEDVVSKLKNELQLIEEQLKLVIIQVGDDFASTKYVQNKVKLGEEIGIAVEILKYAGDVLETTILTKINLLNYDPKVTGLIVQLPLPKQLNAEKITQAIIPTKDVDGFHASNIGAAYLNGKGLVSATPKGVVKMLDYYKIPLKGKRVVIAGSSNYVGKMLAVLLINRGATVTSCNSATYKIGELIAGADIFISAIGSPHFFKKDIFINNQKLVIIDIGISRLNDKSVGDVDYGEVESVVKAISPVPGGVGPMTVAMLMDNVVEAYKRKENNKNDNG